jgi:5-carboxymethyl-2-hydroxymuconate isomerase
MPHVIVEYSANLAGDLDVPALLRALHASALQTGVFPIGGLRTRAHRVEHYCIADLHTDNSFVHVQLKIGFGRDQPTKQRACELIFATLKQQLQPVFDHRPLGITMELQELDAVLSYKHNNMHTYVARRQAGQE